MKHLGQKERELVIEFFDGVISDWVGLPKGSLDMTSLYGIRRYSDGSVLEMHVDTVNSHAASAIMNVAQEGMRKDWKLEILDLKGNLHAMAMKPGDYLLYESAKLLHGRPKPLEGTAYANAFIHFAPKDKKIWDYSWY